MKFVKRNLRFANPVILTLIITFGTLICYSYNTIQPLYTGKAICYAIYCPGNSAIVFTNEIKLNLEKKCFHSVADVIYCCN